MNTSLKLLPLSLLLLTFSISASPNMSENKSPIIPNTPSGFGVNFTGLYLQPGANNLEYAVHTAPVPLPTPNWEGERASPSFTPAFSLGAQYTFATGHDQLNVDWLYLDTDDSDSSSASGSESIAPPYYFGPVAQRLFRSSARGTAKFDVNGGDLVFTHLIEVGKRIQLSPFIGLGSAYLKQDLTANFQGYNAAIGGDHYNISSYNTSKYAGVGPRLGVDTRAYAFSHFAVLADMGGTLMLGSMQSDTSFTSQGADNPTPVHTSMANQSVMQIVPEVDTKLGLTYQFSFQSHSSVELQAGYMLKVYFNGINQVVPTALVPNQFNNGVIAVETLGQDQSNLDMNGPYAKLVWLF